MCVAREDVLTFVNACFASTGQREFYSDGAGQRVSLAFLHAYVAGNYRALYARTLALGLNHANQARIVSTLLASGREARAESRGEENALVTRALHALPTHRAMHLLEGLAEAGVNNRRTRAITRAYLDSPRSKAFRAVKYRRSFRRAALHAHVPLDGETLSFFARGWKERRFTTPIYETFRRAHYAEKDLYALPYSIAEGLAAKHGVERAAFLARIEARMTPTELLRRRAASEADEGKGFALDGTKLSPTKVASYVLSLSIADRKAREVELRALLSSSAAAAAGRSLARFEDVAIVVDRSYSSSGSREKARRPLAVALASVAFLRACSARVTVHLTSGEACAPGDEIFLSPRGSTDLATPVLAALATSPDLLLIVSDGYENDPAGVTGKVLEAAARIAPATFVVHLNPVLDAEALAPKSLTPRVPTLGIREAEDLPALVALARFAREGDAASSTLAALERHLDARVRAFLSPPGGAS